MKQHIKKLSVLLLLIIATIFSSCETEKDYITSENSNQKYQLKEISFAEFKTNQAAFQKLKEAHSKKNSTLKQKGVYNEDYGVFIDTTNIIFVQKENKHSITFQIADEEVINKIQNLVLTSKDDGGYTAYIAEYLLNQQEIQSLKEGEKLENKYPSTITKIDNNSTVNVSESNSGCVYSYYVTRYYCLDNDEQIINSYGNNDGRCKGMSWEITTLIIDIDLGCGGSNPGSGYSGGGLNGGGTNTAGSSGSSNNGNTGNPSNGSGNNSGHDDPVFTTPVLDINAFKEFVLGLTDQQRNWLNNPANSEIKLTLENYINQSPNREVAKNFADELIGLAINEPNQELVTTLINLSIVTKENGYFENSFESNYYSLINPYTEVDTQAYNPIWQVYFSVQCAVARYKLSQEPGWNNLYEWQRDLFVYWEASKEMVHLGLDLIGLAPVVGEIADLTNGVIYTIEGDGVNATLSYASAIPFAGWYAAGIKMAKRADGLSFLVKGANNLITFGAYNSKKFRQACGIAVGDATKQAHHLIPRGSQIIEHEVVQKAAKATTNQGFHIDQALNGIAVATWRNQPNHTNYNNLIKSKLDALPANLTPNQAYAELMDILNQAKQAVINNPNTHLNDLIF